MKFAHMRPILTKIGAKPMAELAKDDYETVKKDLLANTELTVATVHKKLSLLRTIVYYAVERGFCESMKFPTLPSPQYKCFVPPSPDEVAAIYQAAPPHIQRVVVIGAYCGVRIGECELLSLTWDDIDFERKILRVHGSKKNPNAPWREVPIRESLMPLFCEWHKDDISSGNSYLIHFAGKSVTTIKNAWHSTLKRAGITRHIRPYDLRHAFGTELVAAGVDVGTVAKLMGHSSPTMLLTHYQYVMDKQKSSAVEALPDTTPMCRANVPQKNRGHGITRNPLI
ncbi:MAG: site-specific integrase [Desulfovibrio sp.]|nr:site-specific integrase [Desulfovibrio sp.]